MSFFLYAISYAHQERKTAFDRCRFALACLLILNFLGLPMSQASVVTTSNATTIKNELKILIDGLRNGNGYLALTVFPSSARSSFPSDGSKAIEKIYVPLEGKKQMEVVLSGIPEGDYAISMMHDEDSSQKMSYNFVGIPKKGFGFSQNSRIFFGPPSFDHAKIHFTTDADNAETVHMKMKYFL